ncbi:hypothetical protein WR25_02554 [Diploscapter pachys]|uniref:Nuclear anchorage protein 1 spectrin-like repeat domain-containing protein n=1 Tax=Diploscapter pachys TaxID=2018661 RepID=A0A2A2KUI6_9BILA|nr:hypothetical protein WR25_02554 [Diploscapter pachys]
MNVNLTKDKFEELCSDLFNKVMNIVNNALSNAGLNESQIDHVILAGGSTRIPKIREMLSNKFGKIKIKANIDPSEAIAQGAAIAARSYELDERIAKLLDLPIDEILVEEIKKLSLEIKNLPKTLVISRQLLKKLTKLHDNKKSSTKYVSIKNKMESIGKQLETLKMITSMKSHQNAILDLPKLIEIIHGQLHMLHEAAYSDLFEDDLDIRKKIMENLTQFEDSLVKKQEQIIHEELRARLDIHQLQVEIDKAQANFYNISQTSSSLRDFKQSTIPHLAQLAQDIDSVPADFTKRADGLRDRLHKLNKNIDHRILKASENEARRRAAERIINDKRQQLDEILAKYQQGPQPLDTVEQDSRGLKSIIDDIQNVDPSVIESNSQLARDLNDVKQKAKEQSSIFDQNIQNEKPIRDEQKRISDQIAKLRAATSDLPHLDPSQALAFAGDLANAARQLKSDVDNNSDKVHRPSDIVNHNDLNDHLPSDVLALQQAIDDMQRGLRDRIQYESIDSEIQRISDSLATLPSDLPENINDQQQMLENLSSTKERMNKIINDIPDTEAWRKLVEKARISLSKIEDLIELMSDKLIDNMATFAKLRNINFNTKCQLLAITTENSQNPPSEQEQSLLASYNENILKMCDENARMNNSGLGQDEKRELDKLSAQLTNLLVSSEHNETTRKVELLEVSTIVKWRLSKIVETADQLMENPEGIPSQYAPTADQLRSEVSRAKDLIQGRDPSSDSIAHALETAIPAAENRIPQLDDGANTWEEFVRARDDADSTLDSLRQPLDAVLGKSKRSVDEACQDFASLGTASRNIPILSEKIKYLQGLSERLNLLENAYCDVLMLNVNFEQCEKQYDEKMNDIIAEIENEQILTDSANHINNEIDAMLADLQNNPATREHNSNLEDHHIPALRAQLSSLEDKSAEAAGTRKHVSPGMNRLDELRQKIQDLESALQNAKLEADENEREELVLQLRLTLEQLDKKPISELTPSELNALELNIEKLPEKDAQEIMEKISDMKKAKDEHDSKLADARNSIGDLEKSVKELEKKPKKKGTSPSIDELREKLQAIEGLLPRAQELANNPILLDEDRSKVSEIVDRLIKLGDEVRRDLSSTIFKQQK